MPLYYINSIRPSPTACFEFEEFAGARLDVFANRLSQFEDCGSASAPRQRAETSASFTGGLASSSRAVSRTMRLSRSSVMYSTGDLPSPCVDRQNPDRVRSLLSGLC